jgi:cytochrome d ubiquinol oxidase subunit II
VGPVLIGAAVGTFFNGAEFVVNKAQLTEIGMPVISTWANPLHGLEAAFVIWNLLLGLAVFFLSRVLAILYFINNINDDVVKERCRKRLPVEAVLFLVCFLTFFVRLLFAEGFAVDPVTVDPATGEGEVFMEKYKYFNNLIQAPMTGVILLIGVVLVLYGIAKPFIRKSTKGIWYSGTGVVLTVLALLLCAGWNNTAYYPSLIDLQSSLTISNSCSSPFTLKVMTYVSFFIPVVLAYIFYAWRSIDIHKITKEEMEAEEQEMY